MPKPWEMTLEGARLVAEQVREELEEADRHDAYLFAQQLLEDEDAANSVAQPSLFEKLVQVVLLQFRTFSIPLLEPAMAGDVPSFPDRQPLPPEWFSGSTVTLHFHHEASGWEVERSGTLDELKLTFWSDKGEIIDEPIIVGGVPEPVPVRSPVYLSRIDIEIAKS